MNDLERNIKLNENMALSANVSAVAMKKALEEAGKYSWTSTDQRASAILGYMEVYGLMMAATMEDTR